MNHLLNISRVFVLLLLGHHSALAQDARPTAPGSSAVPSSDVPSGELHGIVIDESTGEPIHGAQVTVGRTTLGNLTEANGRFEVRGIAPGWYDAKAEFIGYRAGELPLNMVPNRGWAARFSLSASGVPLCGLVIGGQAIQAEVRDAATGLAPISQVVLRAAADSSSAWGFSEAEPGDSAAWVSVGSWPGVLSVEVAAAGYAPWRRDGVIVERGKCGRTTSHWFKVWLLRTHRRR